MKQIRKTTQSLIFGTTLVMGSAAIAQGLPGGASSLTETHGDWTVVCTAPSGTVKCLTSQTQVSDQNRQRVLAIELAAADDGKSANGGLVLPFGLALDQGVTLAIDESEPQPPLRFSTCLPAGCVVPLTFGQDAIKALRAGKVLKVRAAANGTGEEVTLSVSLSGFASALTRVAELTGS